MYLIRIMLLVLISLSCSGCMVAAAGAGAATGAAIAIDRRTTGTFIDDQTIQIKAMHALARNKELWKQGHINVISYNNVLLLIGQVPNEELKRQAEEAVGDISRVRRVHNELEIRRPTTLGIRSKDSWITTQIKTRMLGSKAIGATRAKVITENKVVYLMGLTTPEEEVAVTDIARTTDGVEKIVQIFEESTT